LVYNNKEEGMKSLMLAQPPSHKCDPKKVEINKHNFQALASKQNQADKALSDLFALMVSGIVLFGQKTIYLNIEELDSAPQPTLPLYRPSFRFKSSTGPQNDLSLGDSERMGEKEEQDEQQRRQPSSWIKEGDCINLGNIKQIKEGHWTYRALKVEKGEAKKSIIIDGSELIDFVSTNW
jgi:hypothetical protein